MAVPTSQTAVCGSAGYNVTDLSREIVSISFTLMRPFLPQLLLPSSQAFILLEKQVLPLVRCPLPASLVSRPVQLLVIDAMMPSESGTSLAFMGRQAWREPSPALGGSWPRRRKLRDKSVARLSPDNPAQETTLEMALGSLSVSGPTPPWAPEQAPPKQSDLQGFL